MSTHLRLILSIGLILATLTASPRAAALTLIRDAEIEHALQQLAQPLLDQAGLSRRTRIVVVRDQSLNAFVTDASAIYVHSGLILRLPHPDALQAVIAHEAAHIANGHIILRAGNYQTASGAAKIGMALALAAGVAAGDAGVAAGLAVGSQSSTMRRFFVHTRAEEASADLSAARYMAMAGVDPNAMVEVLDMFRGQEALSIGRQDPYVRTHPLSADRYRAAKAAAAAYEVAPLDKALRDYWYERAIGKLSAYLRAPSWTLRRIGKKTDEISRLRRAIAYHRQPDIDRAVAEARALIAMKPDDAYYHELLGQILLESRKYDAAVTAYENAVARAPKEPLILAGYGRALLAQNTPGSTKKALQVLERARSLDSGDPGLLRDLGQAYARTGQNGLAAVASAERYALMGRLETAAVHARRALDQLPTGSPAARRAEDIVQAARLFAAQTR